MGQVVYIQEQRYLLYLRQYLSLIGFIWITYSLKSSTSKRKSKNTFAEKIKLTFVKKTQVSYKMQGLSNHSTRLVKIVKLNTESSQRTVIVNIR